MVFETKRPDAATSDINLVEKYGPIGASALRAAVGIRPEKQRRDTQRGELERLLVPEHLPEM